MDSPALLPCTICGKRLGVDHNIQHYNIMKNTIGQPTSTPASYFLAPQDDIMVAANHFCHVTKWHCIDRILEDGLMPHRCRSPLYDGFLEKNPRLEGVWFMVTKEILRSSCYPYRNGVEDVNPMIVIPAGKLRNLLDYDWFLVDVKVNNVKLACVSPNHPERRSIQEEPIPKGKNDYFCCGLDGYYYIPPTGFVSIFIASEENLVEAHSEWEMYQCGRVSEPSNRNGWSAAPLGS